MLDHDLDFPVSFLDRCDLLGLCPDCNDEVIVCRCAEDAEAIAQLDAHGLGCLCCEGDGPARVRFPPARRQIAA